MSTEEFSADFFKVPAYALVIGISRHAHGKEPGQPLDDKDFTNLSVAAKDAEDFARFLEENGCVPTNVHSLLNEQADFKSIKQEFYKLSKKCKQHKEQKKENPLVIVYFSGHGYADDDAHRYLIPYDAERDDLFSTALSTKGFDDLLGELETNKLVVFLDACHSGAMSMPPPPGAKGPGLAYNPAQDLGEGEGRYVIASCKPGQRSWEQGQNSIFTRHLLELLRCKTDDITDEEITTFNLFEPLKERVRASASELEKEQEPFIPRVEGGTGIVLAINKRAREQRIARNAKDRDQRFTPGSREQKHTCHRRHRKRPPKTQKLRE